MPDKRTPEQIAQDDRLTLIKCLDIQHAIRNIGLEPDVYRDGLRVPVYVYPDTTVYVYALPWARGWTMFVSDRVYETLDTRSRVKTQFRYMQSTVYAPRGLTGPYMCDTDKIVQHIFSYFQVLRSWSVARQAAVRKRFWYWPSSALSHGAQPPEAVQ